MSTETNERYSHWFNEVSKVVRAMEEDGYGLLLTSAGVQIVKVTPEDD